MQSGQVTFPSPNSTSESSGCIAFEHKANASVSVACVLTHALSCILNFSSNISVTEFSPVI